MNSFCVFLQMNEEFHQRFHIDVDGDIMSTVLNVCVQWRKGSMFDKRIYNFYKHGPVAMLPKHYFYTSSDVLAAIYHDVVFLRFQKQIDLSDDILKIVARYIF